MASALPDSTQRAQYPLYQEHILNHRIYGIFRNILFSRGLAVSGNVTVRRCILKICDCLIKIKGSGCKVELQACKASLQSSLQECVLPVSAFNLRRREEKIKR